jgi:hypothetical protein
MGNWLSQTYPGEAPKLTEKNLPNQAGKVGGISITTTTTIIVICDQKERAREERWLMDDF